MFKNIQQARLYVRAGDQIEKGLFNEAISSITKAKDLLGRKYDDPRFYEYDIRAANAFFGAGDFAQCVASIKRAIDKVGKSDLNPAEKEYLNRYCRTFLIEYSLDDVAAEESGHELDISKVRWRFVKEYPLIFPQSTSTTLAD